MDLSSLNQEIKNKLRTLTTYEEGITYLRGKLDEITKELINIVTKRAVIVKHVGELKKKHNKPLIFYTNNTKILLNMNLKLEIDLDLLWKR